MQERQNIQLVACPRLTVGLMGRALVTLCVLSLSLLLSRAAHAQPCGREVGSRCVFVTSETFTGDLVGEAQVRNGGRGITDPIEAADFLCQQAAESSNLPVLNDGRKFRAWIATSDTGPDTTFHPDITIFPLNPNIPHQRTDGVLIATDLSPDLLDGMLAAPIHTDEFGVEVVLPDDRVWSNVNADGADGSPWNPNGPAPAPDPALNTCSDWTSRASDQLGCVGDPNVTDATWSQEGCQPCDQPRRLYCVSQGCRFATPPVNYNRLVPGEDCVDGVVPPQLSTQIHTHRGLQEVEVRQFFFDAATQRQRFDFDTDLEGSTIVPETGVTILNDFLNGQRFEIDYTGATPTCTTSILTGEFPLFELSLPGVFQGTFRQNGRPVAIVRNETTRLATEVTLERARKGGFPPVSVKRRNGDQLEVQEFYDFRPRVRHQDLTPPDFCPAAP